MKYRREGFTFVELMLVVAIIGILAAVALPLYMDYTKRTRMSEVVLAVSACRTPVSEVSPTGAFCVEARWSMKEMTFVRQS